MILKFNELNESKSNDIKQLIDKISEYLENGWELFADDTHRWCSSDGFYEVEFSLIRGEEKIFIHNESGDQELEDSWSKDNPQEVYIDDMIFYLDDGDIEYALGMIDSYEKSN